MRFFVVHEVNDPVGIYVWQELSPDPPAGDEPDSLEFLRMAAASGTTADKDCESIAFLTEAELLATPGGTQALSDWRGNDNTRQRRALRRMHESPVHE